MPAPRAYPKPVRTARAALALLLAFAVPVRAETTSDPLWYLLSTSVLAPDAKAVAAEGEGPADARGLAALQADLLSLSDGLESFRDEGQVQETLERLRPRMSPELKPFFKDRSSSLDAIYRTLAVADFTWAQRFPEPFCDPAASRRKLLASPDGLFQTVKGEASPWLVALLGPRAEGKTAEQALDQASSASKMTGAEYERLRARIRRLTLALASEKAVGAARAKLYCSRAAAFADLSAFHRAKDAALVAAGRALAQKPEQSVFAVVREGRRAAAVLLGTANGAMLVTDASIVADTDHPSLFAYSANGKPVELAATVVRRHPGLGVAVLAYSESRSRPALGLADAAPAKDELVTAYGHTTVSGLWTRTSGLVTKTGYAGFQTDAAISPEMSGGPVLDEEGKVAGLLVLRPAETEEGRWPVAVPAPVLSAWLNDPSIAISAASGVEAVEEAGTAAVLSRAGPSAPVEAGLGAWNIPNLPPPPSVPRGVCVQNCGDPRSPGSSYSRRPSSNAGAEALGEALGELALVAIFKGIPALFRGLGKLFKGNGAPAKSPARAEAKAEKEEPPPPPPKPKCELKPISAPAKAGAGPFEVSVRFSCDDDKVRLDGHRIKFTFAWDGKSSTQTATVVTGPGGYASLAIQVSNEETKLEKVRSTSEGSHEELDHYIPEPEEPAPLITAVPEGGMIAAGDPTAADRAIIGTVAATGAAGSAVGPGRIVILLGRGATLRVTAAMVLGPVATGALVLVTAKAVFDIGWSIGTVIEEKISDVQRDFKQKDKSEDCEMARPWQLSKAQIYDPHSFKDEWGARPNSLFDICACKDGSIVIKGHGICGRPGPAIITDKRWR